MMAGVSALRKGISTTMLCAVNSCVRIATEPSRVMKPDTLFVVATGNFSPALHGTGPRDGELLLDLPGPAVRGVVALHHHDLRAVA
jgi:hypothetical protein